MKQKFNRCEAKKKNTKLKVLNYFKKFSSDLAIF